MSRLSAVSCFLFLLLANVFVPCIGQNSASTSTSAQETPSHTFVYSAAPETQTVAIAGTFNNWNHAATPMTRDADRKTWRATVPLPWGKHLYKYVVNGNKWLTDPQADQNERDASGNLNSVLLLLPADYRRPARPDDGIIATSALRHLTNVPHLNYDRGRLQLSLRVRPGDIKHVQLRVNSLLYPMQLSQSDEVYATYVAQVPWDRKSDLSYHFELNDGHRLLQFGASGLTVPQDTPEQPHLFHITAAQFQPFEVPTWVERSVFYQIFPDRFANGDKSNDPADVQQWDAKPTGVNRFGGDVAGVRQHLSYLTDLGISAVYFNPVFLSPSNHRYDAEDFKKIDPQFGTNQEFASLTRELRAKNIRTVMDFVFNHSATTFPPFADIRKKGKESTYNDWYFIKSYPVMVQEKPNYVAWSNFSAMPKLNLLNPETRDYMLGLVDFWHSNAALSGMRLDVANEVEPEFWRLLRRRAKAIDPQMWIVGEVWDDGSPWLGGDQWDSVMNYQFRKACIGFFAEEKTTAEQFLIELMRVHRGYAPQVSRNMMNLLSSHDTPRFLTLCQGDERKHRLAATVQFTWIGAPSIYYGEEIAMLGGADPDNRRAMEWNKTTPDNAMLRFYKRLIEVRGASRALHSGDPVGLFANNTAGTLAFARRVEDDVAIVAINRSNASRTLIIPVSPELLRSAGTGNFVDALSHSRIAVQTGNSFLLTLEPQTAAVLLPERASRR